MYSYVFSVAGEGLSSSEGGRWSSKEGSREGSWREGWAAGRNQGGAETKRRDKKQAKGG